jgi:hypothetical protein
MAAVFQPSGATASNLAPSRVNSRQSLSTRLARLSGDDIARAIGADVTTASRVASDQRGATLSQWCALIELAGLKLVSQDKHCIAGDELRMLRRVYANVIARDLVWEDAE